MVERSQARSDVCGVSRGAEVPGSPGEPVRGRMFGEYGMPKTGGGRGPLLDEARVKFFIWFIKGDIVTSTKVTAIRAFTSSTTSGSTIRRLDGRNGSDAGVSYEAEGDGYF